MKALGGKISSGRIFGRLIVTRSFGDFVLKHRENVDRKLQEVNYVSIEPDIRSIKVNFESDAFLMVASDGIFDKMTLQF